MKKSIVVSLFFFSVLSYNISAQEVTPSENHGNTLNIGVGVGGYGGYYGYVRHSMPVYHLNYEYNMSKSFTLAPFISYYTYNNNYYWGITCVQDIVPYKYYNYHETVIPAGIKVKYYFNKLLNTGSKWDLYVAGSAGIAMVNAKWESGYQGNRNYFHNNDPLFLDGNIGTEYHIDSKLGIFLDISTGVATIGLSFHQIK
jgi:hypothetical protein